MPATVGTVVDLLGRGQVQRRRELRGGEGGPANQHRLHRVGLVRHRRRSAAGALGELGDLGTRQHEHVVGDPGARVGAAHQGVAEPGDRGARRVPARHADRWLETELDDRGAGARGSAELVGEREAGEVVVRVEHRRQPRGHPEAERRRHRVLGQGPRDHRGVAVDAGETGEPLDDRGEITAYVGHGGGGHPHQRRVDDVLAGQSPVQPPGVLALQPLSEEADQRDHRVAAELGLAGQPLGPVGHLEVAADPVRLDRDHHLEERLRGEVVAGAVVPGPEQIGHGLSLARRTGRRSPPRPGAGCRRRSPGRRHVRPGSATAPGRCPGDRPG